MPELPEVETIRRQLKEVLMGRSIKKVEVLREKSFSGDPETMKGWEIADIQRKAKVIEILFAGKSDVVIVHLKMTGQLVFIDGEKRILGGHPTADWVKDLPSKHTRVVWTFKDGSKLFFNDMRVFGWMRLMSQDKYEKEIRKTVPDITDDSFTEDFLAGVLKNSKKPVKLVLLDQDKIGGLGNIYVNDALFLAGVRPERKSDSLDKKEVKKLHAAIVKVINLGIKYGGASASNYVDVAGLGGTYQDHFLVYKREGLNCLNCDKKIEKVKLGGRGTFYCPYCQK
jgi:formamidopyrimidine-DNA glycosylase